MNPELTQQIEAASRECAEATREDASSSLSRAFLRVKGPYAYEEYLRQILKVSWLIPGENVRTCREDAWIYLTKKKP